METKKIEAAILEGLSNGLSLSKIAKKENVLTETIKQKFRRMKRKNISIVDNRNIGKNGKNYKDKTNAIVIGAMRDGKSPREISEILGIRVETAKQRIARLQAKGHIYNFDVSYYSKSIKIQASQKANDVKKKIVSDLCSKACSMYLNGMEITEISKALNISLNSVYKFLKLGNVPKKFGFYDLDLANRAENKKKRRDANIAKISRFVEERNRIHDHLLSGMIHREIANIEGCSMNRVCNVAKRFGLTRNRGGVGVVYIIQDLATKLVKIGYTQNVEERFAKFSSILVGGFSTIDIIYGMMIHDEFDLHDNLKTHRIEGQREWYRPEVLTDPVLETFVDANNY